MTESEINEMLVYCFNTVFYHEKCLARVGLSEKWERFHTHNKRVLQNIAKILIENNLK